jgi:small-conductance mechanosensitive channel
MSMWIHRYGAGAVGIAILFFAIIVVGAGASPDAPAAATIQDQAANVGSGHSTTPTNPNFEHDVLAKPPLAEVFQKHSTLAGSLHPLYHSLILSRKEAGLLWKTLQTNVHWQDMALLAAAGWLTVPIAQMHYELLPPVFRRRRRNSAIDGFEVSSSSANQSTFRRTALFQVADHLQQISQIALAVYAVDIFKLVCMAMGIHACQMEAFPHAVCQIAYTVWLANRLMKLVRYSLRRYVSDHPETFGRMRIFNRLVDAILYAIAFMITLNIMNVQMGIAMQSILTFGSVGTLAVGLASQGIAREVLNGLMLASSDRLYEGDDVHFGNGISGTIVNLGWMETVLRSSDESLLSVPNTELFTQRVSNLSRVRLSQVKQVLNVTVADADHIPLLLDRLIHEIKLACPQLVTDGTRPFRVAWTGINGDGTHEVTIDTRHKIKPTSDDYWVNRQNLLAAIQRALKQHGSLTASSGSASASSSSSHDAE